MNSAPASLFEDPLLGLITQQGLYPGEQSAIALTGKTRNIRNVNAILPDIAAHCSVQAWLEAMTRKLLNVQFLLQDKAQGPPQALKDFHYVPVPGTENAKLIIPEGCNSQRPAPDAALKTRVEASALIKSPLPHCRELAWLIAYRSQNTARTLIFIFTFDPFHLITLRTDPEAAQRSHLYWTKLATEQHLLSGRETITPLYLNALCSLHEWLEHAIVQPHGPPPQWTRHPVPNHETQLAAPNGIDLYLSTTLAAYGWSTLQTLKGRERSRIHLQHLLSKKIILFDPIYSNTTGQPAKPKSAATSHAPRLDIDERELTARAIYNQLMIHAYNIGASDIHFEPLPAGAERQPNAVVSLRTDNTVTFWAKFPHDIAQALLVILLDSSGVIRTRTDIGQDGRKTWTHPHKPVTIDLRISVTPMPNATLQEVVVRLLDNSRLKNGLQTLGLQPHELDLWGKALSMEESLILVSGPTGSGKSSTLFAAICEIHKRDPTRKITSIEDPIEYTFPFRATQHEVNEDTTMTFAAYLRRMVRNDIDTVLVGEIRDAETLNAALQLGLTGHQILSSIHAKSSTDTILRMLEFKPELYTLSEVVKLVVAQRLAPTPCPSCRNHLEANDAEKLIHHHGGLPIVLGNLERWKSTFPHSQDSWTVSEGCPSCRYSGAQGKTAIQEFLAITSKNRAHLKNANLPALAASMNDQGFDPLATTAWRMAWQGIITIPEAARLTNTLETRYD